jgi:nucleotide-binding universal stress UspA family protein
MIRKLLIAYDGSNAARAAYDFGSDLALKYGAELHVPAVARPPEFGTEEETEAVIEQSRGHCEKLLDTPKPQLDQRGAILTVAVGHRGRTLFDRLLVGSVARQVVAHARCGVSVLR